MFLLRTGFVILLLLAGFASAGHAQDKEKPFPTNDEINLLFTQADRAMEQYKAIVDLEERQFAGTPGESEAVAKDKEVSSGWEAMSKGMKTKPQAFNSRFGLEIVLLLDDAARNALLCSNQASLRIPTSGNATDAEVWLHLVQSCSDTSTLIYTVSESAAALYQKYLDAAEQLAKESIEVATKCTAILKNNGASKH